MEDKGSSDQEIMKEKSSGKLGLFFAIVLTTLALAACILGGINLHRSGACPSCPSGMAPKMMATDMVKELKYRMEDGETMMTQRTQYDHDSNVVVIEAPGNFSEYSSATIALDYDRTLMFVHLHVENVCIVMPWPSDIAEHLRNYVSTDGNDGEIIDIISMSLEERSYSERGPIPAGYVRGSNGMTVGALCSSRDTHWVDLTSQTSNRQRRGWFGIAKFLFRVAKFTFKVVTHFTDKRQQNKG